ncbi:MAG: RHS repeat-associated core domain-containing protein, partial [Parachlamydiales bacterium]
MIENSVDVISGVFFKSSDDLMVRGNEPLILRRIYDTTNSLGINGGWDFFPQIFLLIHLNYEIDPSTIDSNSPDYDAVPSFAILKEPTGTTVLYGKKAIEGSPQDEYTPEKLCSNAFRTHLSGGLLGGRYNYKNNKIIIRDRDQYPITSEYAYKSRTNRTAEAVQLLADGTKRYYRSIKIKDWYLKQEYSEHSFLAFYLYKEIKSNGNVLLYEYDGTYRLKSIASKNPTETADYCSLRFEYDADNKRGELNNRNFSVYTSDGQSAHYQFLKHPKYKKSKYEFTFPLQQVVINGVVKENLYYDEGYDQGYGKHTDRNKTRGPFVVGYALPEGRRNEIVYYNPGDYNGTTRIKAAHPICDRVRRLKLPRGNNGSLVDSYEFTFDLDKYDTENYKFRKDNCQCHLYNLQTGYQTRYYFTGDLYINDIQFYKPINGTAVLYKRHEFRWDDRQNLISKKYYDGQGHLLLEKGFVYDQKNNVIEESLKGDLIGDGSWQIYKKQYFYNENNLPIERREDSGLKIRYEYLKNTDLVTKKLTYHQDKIVLRNFYEYSPDHVLVQTIEDNGLHGDVSNLTGITEKRIMTISLCKKSSAYNLPEIIEEKGLDLSSGKEKLIKKTKFIYSKKAQVLEEQIYNRQNCYCYSIHYQYDDIGRLISQTDALGRKKTFKYNLNDEIVSETDFGDKYTLKRDFDAGGRVIKEAKAVKNIDREAYLYTYDGQNYLRSQQDHLGLRSDYEYDGDGNLIKTVQPPVFTDLNKTTRPINLTTFDSLGRQTKTTDGRGHLSVSEYNVYGSLTKIKYPDQTEETFLYNQNGSLASQTDQEGNTTVYIKDLWQRDLKKSFFSKSGNQLKEEKFTYSTFHKLSYLDPLGHLTSYKYDYAGRKLEKYFEGKLKTAYVYDDLGRKNKKIRYYQDNALVEVYEKDLLDRLTEKRKEDLSGKILFKETYAYDLSGNLVQTIRYPNNQAAIQKDSFDWKGRKISSTDSLGHTTHYKYYDGHRYLSNLPTFRKDTVDPVGLITTELFDGLQNPIYIEKVIGNKRLFLQRQFYDPNSNFTKLVNTIILPNNSAYEVVLENHYDPLNRKIAQIKDASSPCPRITRYEYTKKGYLKTTYKPDRIRLENSYNALGFLERLKASDGSVDYTYSYDLLGRLLAIEDNVSKHSFSRQLDPLGNLIFEKNPCFKLTSSYDGLNRKKHLQVEDCFALSYTYDALHLRSVKREGKLNYEHQFLEYDLAGHLLKEKNLCGQTIEYLVDPLGRRKALKTPELEQIINTYAPDGKVLSVTTNVLGTSDIAEYTYDELKQLSAEKGLFENVFAYDSNYNCRFKNGSPLTYDNLDQLLKGAQTSYVYNLNGAPLEKKGPSGLCTFLYDALDRLISCEANAFRLEFNYDGLNRLVLQKVYARSELKEAWAYIYDDKNEIGAFELKKQKLELRALSDTSQAEIGSAVALELNGRIFAPLHDLFGNLFALFDPQQKLVELYRYSAFGQELIFNGQKQELASSHVGNFWRFVSKRKIEQLNQIFFGRRFYDPETGRFFTPDPQGYNDSYNLYAYVLNDPLLGRDLYGLFFFDKDKSVLEMTKEFVYNTLANP